MTGLLIEAPSDDQLRYIADLCDERGLDKPDAVASKREASEIIQAILAREYEPVRYAYPFVDTYDDVPFR